ncbi:Protein NDX-7 [Aphelenchoides avenae]|nr:Protein NDX-7 [Aphelenchus avenae]
MPRPVTEAKGLGALMKANAANLIAKNGAEGAENSGINTELRHVLMLKRGATAKFMPNSYVFPGGLIEPIADAGFPRDKTNFAEIDEKDARIFQLDGMDDDFALRVCATRELFEESGMLLVEDGQSRERRIATAEDDPSLAHWRQKVCTDPSTFPDLFFGNTQLDVASLLPWSNWLTPTTYKKRFDTVFYVAPVDSSKAVDFCEREMSESLWDGPSRLMEQTVKAMVSLPPPQYYELARIRLAAVCDLPNMANPLRILPQTVQAEDNPNLRGILLPGDHLFVDEDQESVGLRVMRSEQLIPESV